MATNYILNEGVSNCCNANVLENTERCSECQENCVVIYPTYIILHEDKQVFKGTETECFIKLLNIQPNSCHYATTWGGYKIIEDETQN